MLPLYSDLNIFRKDLVKLKALYDANKNLLNKLKSTIEAQNGTRIRENELINNVIKELLDDKPRFNDYLAALGNFYEDYINIYLKKKEFINQLFEQSEDEELSYIVVRSKKIKKNKQR